MKTESASEPLDPSRGRSIRFAECILTQNLYESRAGAAALPRHKWRFHGRQENDKEGKGEHGDGQNSPHYGLVNRQ